MVYQHALLRLIWNLWQEPFEPGVALAGHNERDGMDIKAFIWDSSVHTHTISFGLGWYERVSMHLNQS